MPMGRDPMSYARPGDLNGTCDIYVYEGRYTSGVGYVICLACLLADGDDDFITSHRFAMAAHVEQHIAEGHEVPEWTVPGLIADGDLIVGDEPGAHA